MNMKHILIRFVILILVPCLLADPTLALALSQQCIYGTVGTIDRHYISLQQEALSTQALVQSAWTARPIQWFKEAGALARRQRHGRIRVRLVRPVEGIPFAIPTLSYEESIQPVQFMEDQSQTAGSGRSSAQRSFTYPAGNLQIQVSNPNNNYAVTSEGAVSIGLSMLFRTLYPEAADYPSTVIAPSGSWVASDGANLMQLYFGIAANFAFHKRKTKIVATPGQIKRIQRYLELGNPYELPNVAGYPEEFMKQMRREAYYLADRASIDGKTQMATPYPDMVEFVPLDEKGQAQIGQVRIKRAEEGRFVIEDSAHQSSITLDGHNMSELQLDIEGAKPVQIPDFGVTFLGTSSGMDPNGMTSNQIVWAGRRHFLIDIGAPTRAAMTTVGLNPSNITDVMITHLHEDHVAGALAYFHWHQEYYRQHSTDGTPPPIRLWMEPGVYAMFEEQATQILGRPLREVYSIELVAQPFYSSIELAEDGVLVEAAPAWHGTPVSMYRFTYKGQTISHSSDTTYDPVRFEQIVNNQMPDNIRADMVRILDEEEGNRPVFGQERADEITHWLFNPNSAGNDPALAIYEVGNRAEYDKNQSNHTTAYALHRLPERYQKAITTNHAPSLPPGEFEFPLTAPLTTIEISPKKSTSGTGFKDGIKALFIGLGVGLANLFARDIPRYFRQAIQVQTRPGVDRAVGQQGSILRILHDIAAAA